tara:strand:- start:3958 stop:4722 length:765 start_codon:yes stop_codon:yes gene_type:complete
MFTAQEITNLKSKEKIVMLTAYDYTLAKIMDNLVDLILVGDSMAMVVLGHKDTTEIKIEDLLQATKSVSKGAKNTFIVGDMPLGSYNNNEEALISATHFINAGAHAVKIEKNPSIAKFLTENKIKVMGHVGLTPQTITDFKVQGKDDTSAKQILQEAKELENSGCFSIVLECIPIDLAKEITNSISIPTIGIGAGPNCDGQVLVTHDLLGLFEDFKPKFVKRYTNLGREIKKAIQNYKDEVKNKRFPDDNHSFH